VRFGTALFAALVDRGWDAHLVLDGNEAARWPGLAKLSDPARIHLSPRHRPVGRARADIPRRVVRELSRHPGGAARYLRAGGRPRLRLLRGHDVEAALIACRPRVVHFDSPFSAAERMRVRHVVGCRSLVTVAMNEVGPPGAGPPDALTTAFEEADVLHVADEAVWQRLLAAGCPPGKARLVAPFPVTETDFFAPGALDGATGGASRPLRILSVGPLSWIQGYEWSLQALALLVERSPGCQCRIIGRGPHMEALYFARHQLGLERQVELVDQTPDREELRAQLRWADVYLDSAVAEGSISAAWEAMAMAVPVVATDRTVAPRALVDGETGFVVARRDPQAMAQRLALLHSDVALRRRMAQAARRRLLERFPPEQQIAELERGYREVLDA
jgi:colanic acid/amylovoran biosynthesis glycosyltransferase